MLDLKPQILKEYIRACDHIRSTCLSFLQAQEENTDFPDISTNTFQQYCQALIHMENTFSKYAKMEQINDSIPEESQDKTTEFTNLRMLLKEQKWPTAINPELLWEENEDNYVARANQILTEFVTTDLKEKSFLNFSLEKDLIVREAKKICKLALDYGPEAEKNTYDIILLYDVLDHLETSQEEVLRKLKALLKPDGKIFVRCHPWSSPHGTHLYRKLNKGYLHLVFSEQELKSMNLFGKHTLKITNPIKHYRELFEKLGFKFQENIITDRISSFYVINKKVSKKIKEHWPDSDPTEPMSIHFIDYVLTQ